MICDENDRFRNSCANNIFVGDQFQQGSFSTEPLLLWVERFPPLSSLRGEIRLGTYYWFSRPMFFVPKSSAFGLGNPSENAERIQSSYCNWGISILIHRLHSRLFLKIDLYDIDTVCLWKSTSLSSIQLQTTVELKRFFPPKNWSWHLGGIWKCGLKIYHDLVVMV